MTINNLSILIPCYNGVSTALVTELSRQAKRLQRKSAETFRYEIIVGDDGSTDLSAIEKNEEINELPNCRYVKRDKNCGRAVIRNFLAAEAQYEWLLFVDCDMLVFNSDYLENYTRMDEAPVTYGGYVLSGNPDHLTDNLRYRYETRHHKNHNAGERGKHPYNDFHTSNFLVRRDIMLAYPLDERFRKYGYEDVLWGKTMRSNNIRIRHTDNPVDFVSFESNAEFLRKTDESIETLLEFSGELEGYSSLLATAKRLRRWHLIPLVRLIHRTFGNAVRRNLLGRKPSPVLFSLYKLCALCDSPLTS